MSTDLEFPVEKQRAWEKIKRLLDKELEDESQQYQDDIKSIMASTLHENEDLFVEDLPYLFAAVKEGNLASLRDHADKDAVEKVQKLVDILEPKIKSLMKD